MAQVTLNPLPRSTLPSALDARRRTVPSEEPGPQRVVRSMGPGPMALDVSEQDAAAHGTAKVPEGGNADGVRTSVALASLDPTDASAWESAWMPAPCALDSTGSNGLRFELELRAWGRLEIGCAPLHPRGWHVSIASDNAAVRRRLRSELGRLGAALRHLAGHDDMTLEINA